MHIEPLTEEQAREGLVRRYAKEPTSADVYDLFCIAKALEVALDAERHARKVAEFRTVYWRAYQAMAAATRDLYHAPCEETGRAVAVLAAEMDGALGELRALGVEP